MRRVLLVLAILLGLAVAYLLFAPTPLAPLAWTPPPPVPLEGPYAVNDRLAKAERLLVDLPGPEAVAEDSQGRLLSALADGRVVRFNADGSNMEVLANTGGRPLGLRYHPDGRLFICDALRGLLALDASGRVHVLASRTSAVPVYLADDLAIARDGAVYFTDASSRHGLDGFTEDILEHQLSGRLLKYSPPTGGVSVVAEGFNFANGVTFGPDEDWVVVTETGSYLLWKVWVAGANVGKKEVFASLHGFPDNVSWSPAKRRFWLAVGSPRKAIVDSLAPHPFLRKVVSRLPAVLQPAPDQHGMVLALDEQGRAVDNLQDRSPTSYSPVASVIEHEGFLYLGSFSHAGIARLPVP